MLEVYFQAYLRIDEVNAENSVVQPAVQGIYLKISRKAHLSEQGGDGFMKSFGVQTDLGSFKIDCLICSHEVTRSNRRSIG